MNRLAICLVSIALAMMAVLPAAAQSMFQPIAVVNDSAITGFDLDQRMRLIRVLEGDRGNPQRLRNDALEMLVNDRLKLQYGKRFGLQADDDAIARGLESFAENRGTTVSDLNAQFDAAGISKSAVDDLVAAQLVWNEVVRSRFQSRITPGEADIDAEIALITARRGKEFRLREIGLPATGDGRSAAETEALANRLSQQITTEAEFIEAVAKYSRSPSAQRQGDIGWVEGSKLPAPLLNAITGLEPGQVAAPLPIQGGYSLIQLSEVRDSASAEALASDPAIRERIRERLVTQQTDRLAEGLLQELRRDAIIRLR